MDPSLISGSFAFNNGGTVVILPWGAMADYPYEPIQFCKRNQGRTDSGERYCYTHWQNKHRWPLHFRSESGSLTDTLASFFNQPGTTFWFCPNHYTGAVWWQVACVDDEWSPTETYLNLFSFDVTLEEI